MQYKQRFRPVLLRKHPNKHIYRNNLTPESYPEGQSNVHVDDMCLKDQKLDSVTWNT